MIFNPVWFLCCSAGTDNIQGWLWSDVTNINEKVQYSSLYPTLEPLVMCLAPNIGTSVWFPRWLVTPQYTGVYLGEAVTP